MWIVSTFASVRVSWEGINVAIQVHRVHVIEGVQREQGRRIVGVESAVTALTERIAELERDNMRLRGIASVEGQRVDRLQQTPIIAPTIPPSPDYTPASLDYSPAFEAESDPSEVPSSSHILPLPVISPFLSSDDDTTDSDTSDTPPSLTHDTPFTEFTASTQRSPVIPSRRVMILAPGQPIPHGRPYRYHPNGPVHTMTVRKRVRPLPVQLLVRHLVDHSSSDSSSRHSSSDHSSSDLQSTSAGPSHKRRRFPMTSVPALPLVSGALSPVRADLIPPPKRVKDIGYLADVEDDPRETRDERVTHPAMPEDIPEPAQEGAAEVTYETLGDLVQRIVGVKSAVTALTERVDELERDNQRLKGTASVKSQRVDRLQRDMSRMQREMRQMRRF
nr:hypothetical protein [Tanacetum cinerariifolium]